MLQLVAVVQQRVAVLRRLEVLEDALDGHGFHRVVFFVVVLFRGRGSGVGGCVLERIVYVWGLLDLGGIDLHTNKHSSVYAHIVDTTPQKHTYTEMQQNKRQTHTQVAYTHLLLKRVTIVRIVTVRLLGLGVVEIVMQLPTV